MRVKIIGAGSIGNHLAHAARKIGWNVTLTDIDNDALERTKKQIYPARYSFWDDQIVLKNSSEPDLDIYDIIFIGTPPDSHIQIALNEIEKKPKILVIEKPLCAPYDNMMHRVVDRGRDLDVKILIGYDHSISRSALALYKLINDRVIGDYIYIDSSFCEHWGGIFAAHPWLDGPADSYLGFWRRGGGALSEHSHGLHLLLVVADLCNLGKPKLYSSCMNYIKSSSIEYDQVAFLNIQTESGVPLRLVQDVVTFPPKKFINIVGSNGSIRWETLPNQGIDRVTVTKQKETQSYEFKKTRPDDFIEEMNWINRIYNCEKLNFNPLDIHYAIEVDALINSAHKYSEGI